jgi:hypothetical protein
MFLVLFRYTTRGHTAPQSQPTPFCYKWITLFQICLDPLNWTCEGKKADCRAARKSIKSSDNSLYCLVSEDTKEMYHIFGDIETSFTNKIFVSAIEAFGFDTYEPGRVLQNILQSSVMTTNAVVNLASQIEWSSKSILRYTALRHISKYDLQDEGLKAEELSLGSRGAITVLIAVRDFEQASRSESRKSFPWTSK